MKLISLVCLFACLFISATLFAEEDITVLEGGAAMGGILETTINAQTTGGVHKVYELKRGQFYMMHGPINVDNAGGSLTIRAEAGDGPKPILIRVPLNEVPVGINEIEGSLTLQNLQYHGMQVDMTSGGDWGQFTVQGNDSKLLVEDCLFEFAFGTLFNTDAVENGLVAVFRNNYFRDFHSGGQWWAGRVLNCKVPVDTLIFENNTTTGAGMTFLSQECMFDYAVINHNTFINNTKYPFLNQYWKTLYMTNNLFVNANWVGEDYENMIQYGAGDPDRLPHGLVGLDTITTHIWCNGKYLNGDSTALTSDVDEISDYIWYAADNICVQSATLSEYYNGTPNDGIDGAPASRLSWSGMGDGPWKVINVPGNFINTRTENLIADHNNIKAENNNIYELTAEDLGFGTDPLPQAAADVYINWNRSMWNIPDVERPDITPTYFGDYDPNTIPGIETENSQGGGIRKISDLIEDFSYSADLRSKIDGLPIGALHWDDIDFDREASLEAIKNAYKGGCQMPDSVKVEALITDEYCPGSGDGSIDITISKAISPLEYRWSNGTESEDLSDITSGNFELTITDANKCWRIENFHVSSIEENNIQVESSITDESCSGASNGAIALNVSGPNAPFTYLWSNGTTSENLGNISSGDYELTITDALNCKLTDRYIISPVQLFEVGMASSTSPTCAGEENASISLEVSGGQAPYLIHINDSLCDETGELGCGSIGSGWSEVQITDAEGCYAEGQFFIPEPEQIEISFSESAPICFGDSSGKINANISGGTPPYSFTWDNGKTTEDLQDLGAGLYELNVTDENGCIITGSAEIVELDEIFTGSITGLKNVSETDVATYSVNQTHGSVYTWEIVGGNNLSTIQGNSVNIQWGNPGTGTVSVQETIENHCTGAPVSIEVQIKSLTGTDKDLVQGFSIKPNPTFDRIIIKAANPGEYTVELNTLNGHLLYQSLMEGDSHQIDLSSYQKGAYLITIRSKDFITTEKIIKL